MDLNKLLELPHRRFNPLTGEWILVSPHRTARPWQGEREEREKAGKPSYDPNCYLCPGNRRAGGLTNPNYQTTYSFINDFPALIPDIHFDESTDLKFERGRNLLLAKPERGICKVICFSPRHDLTLATMREEEILPVVELWIKEYEELGSRPFINYVQIFENRGVIMGCSNHHPHGQVWATSSIPNQLDLETRNQQEYKSTNGSCLICDYLKLELDLKERVVYSNDSFVVVVPFWAIWPFEIMVIPGKHMTSISEMGRQERLALAESLRITGIRYDNLFLTDFPYSMGIHQRPTDGKEHREWHFHLHYYPPLLRSATVKKFMVGFEMLAMPQRDITAEKAAERLKEQSDIHYRVR
ncbi:MAG: galactose-1-phosphate uridylyltransferase [Spirochaetes bacterium]|nr:MAG: galactose-1-phosphate uridylyltransferase [Spirochaetota bacterium]